MYVYRYRSTPRSRKIASAINCWNPSLTDAECLAVTERVMRRYCPEMEFVGYRSLTPSEVEGIKAGTLSGSEVR